MIRCLTLQELPPAPPGKTGWPWTEESPQLPDRMPDGSEWLKISIVTPSYNQGEFLEKTIRSVLLQGYPNLEYIIMDGGSNDESVKIIQKYAPWLSYWVSQSDGGQSDAINAGFSRANGEILGWLNSDDYYLPKALYTVSSYPWKPHVGAIVGIGHSVDIQENIVNTPPFKELTFTAFLDWMKSSNFMQPSCFFTKSAWLDCGPLDSSLNYCMDVKLWLDISQKYSFEKIDRVLSHSLAHNRGKTKSQGEYSRAETILLIQKYGGEHIAKREIYQLMDDLVYYRSIVHKIRDLPLIKQIGLPIFRYFRRLKLRR
jgi:glycosyltransferase involved in cell wall biosynthesis